MESTGGSATHVDDRVVLIMGAPRSGTSLTCALLGRLDDTVALIEPFTNRRLVAPGSREGAIEVIAEFVRRTRRRALREGVVISKHEGGALYDNSGDAVRRGERVTRGVIEVGKPLSDDFTLCVKENPGFTALLPELAEQFRCVAIVRNPLATVLSQASIEFAVAPGAIGLAHQLDQNLWEAYQRIDDPIDRRIFTLRWYHERYATSLPSDAVVRYEDIVASRGRALAAVTPRAAALDEDLESRNERARGDVATFTERLLAAPPSPFYSPADVEALATAIRSSAPAAD